MISFLLVWRAVPALSSQKERLLEEAIFAFIANRINIKFYFLCMIATVSAIPLK